jgi:accessory colonization factor AcfC
MVEPTLTDEQKALRELAHDFAEKEIRPVAWDYDRDGTWPQAIIEKAHEVFEGDEGVIEAIAGPFEIDWARDDLESCGARPSAATTPRLLPNVSDLVTEPA